MTMTMTNFKSKQNNYQEARRMIAQPHNSLRLCFCVMTRFRGYEWLFLPVLGVSVVHFVVNTAGPILSIWSLTTVISFRPA